MLLTQYMQPATHLSFSIKKKYPLSFNYLSQSLGLPWNHNIERSCYMPCPLPNDYVSNTPNLSALLPITATIFSYITKIEFFIFCIHLYSLNVLFVLPLKLDKILSFFHEMLQNDFSCREKFKTITYLTFIP